MTKPEAKEVSESLRIWIRWGLVNFRPALPHEMASHYIRGERVISSCGIISQEELRALMVMRKAYIYQLYEAMVDLSERIPELRPHLDSARNTTLYCDPVSSAGVIPGIITASTMYRRHMRDVAGVHLALAAYTPTRLVSPPSGCLRLVD